MTFAIITHTPHFKEGEDLYAYTPYIREMNIWLKHVDKVIIVAPMLKASTTKIHSAYTHDHIGLSRIPSISLVSFSEVIKSLLLFPYIFFKVFRAMWKADHIHLRCPGNIGLIGCLVQVLFPKKPKTAKYAGNWDPNAKQPRSYRFQKWLLGNTFFTKNMDVLVYGEWPKQSKNIKSFFTATYPKSKFADLFQKSFNGPYRLMFVGSLVKGKRPLYALQLLKELLILNISVVLDVYGDGTEHELLEKFVQKNQLSESVIFHGNRESQTIERAFKESHMLLLPSKSEGWPKVVAEAMFWGVIPVVTPISCVPWMLGMGDRGLLLSMDLSEDIENIVNLLKDEGKLDSMSEAAKKWSRQYTLDDFEDEIIKLL